MMTIEKGRCLYLDLFTVEPPWREPERERVFRIPIGSD